MKTKRLLREKVWFPGIDKLTEDKINNCLPCQASAPESTAMPEPLNMTELPNGPWKEVAIDFAGPFPSGECLMVVIDEYSRFPEVEILTSTSARAVIPKLDAIFARQGILDVLKSDNGPPFNSHEFKKFVEHLGFEHRRITPYWPKANGEAERFVRTLGKCTRSAHAEGRNWNQDLHKFLRQYRATPHSTTNISPCEALNQRKLKKTLPEPSHSQTTPYDSHSNMKFRDAVQKSKMKAYADNKAHAREKSMNPGTVVLMKQPKANKLSTPFNPNPLVVKEKKGTMVTVRDGSKMVTRNSSQFKVIPKVLMKFEKKEGEEEEIEFTKELPTSAAEPIPVANPIQDQIHSPTEFELPPLRGSTRQKKPPVRLSDYV